MKQLGGYFRNLSYRYLLLSSTGNLVYKYHPLVLSSFLKRRSKGVKKIGGHLFKLSDRKLGSGRYRDTRFSSKITHVTRTEHSQAFVFHVQMDLDIFNKETPFEFYESNLSSFIHNFATTFGLYSYYIVLRYGNKEEGYMVKYYHYYPYANAYNGLYDVNSPEFAASIAEIEDVPPDDASEFLKKYDKDNYRGIIELLFWGMVGYFVEKNNEKKKWRNPEAFDIPIYNKVL